MKGGELLATGSSSCIFRPNIPCNDNESPDKSKVSKIVYGDKAQKYYDREKSLSKLLKSIKGSQAWCIYSKQFCQPPLYENIFQYDKQMLNCKDRDYEKIFNESSKMMISKYGGITLEDYFIENVLVKKSLYVIEQECYKLLEKMKQLFIGLKNLYNYKIVHLDIKWSNIVLDGKYFKYIDFGLSSELKYVDHFKTRSLSQFGTKRVYLWYPLEYLYSVIDSNQKYIELTKLKSNPKFRKHFTTGIDIHRLFNEYFDNNAKNLLSSNKSIGNNTYKQLVSMIDTYSLGIIIPFFFIEYDIVEYIEQSSFLKDLFKLCKDMCKLDFKQRITPDICLKRYNSLMKKYLNLSSKKGKKTYKNLSY